MKIKVICRCMMLKILTTLSSCAVFSAGTSAFIMMKNQNTNHSNKDYVSQDRLIKSLVPALKAARDDRNFAQEGVECFARTT